MYIEETGAGDGDIKVIVGGEEYPAEANFDLDGNGIDDSLVVMTDEGHVEYVDEDTDGTVDLLRQVDEQGAVTEQSRFMAHSGEWVDEHPGQPPLVQSQSDGSGDGMVVETENGEFDVGTPTEDSDGDGAADTAVLTKEHETLLVTDMDGDGSADQVVEIDDRGGVSVSQHTGDGEWTTSAESGSTGDGADSGEDGLTSTDDETWTFGWVARPWGGEGDSSKDDSDGIWV